jgi:hypothetical protein
MDKEVPSYVRFLNLHYIIKGAISGRLREKTLAKILILNYSDFLITIIRIIDPGVIRIRLAK